MATLPIEKLYNPNKYLYEKHFNIFLKNYISYNYLMSCKFNYRWGISYHRPMWMEKYYYIFEQDIEYNYYYKYLVQKDNIEYIKNNIHEDWTVFVYSPFVKENIDKYPIHRFAKMNMSYGNIFDILDIIRKYPKSRDWIITVSGHPSLTMDIIKNNLDMLWNVITLSKHPNITMEDIENNIDFNWCWPHVIDNPNFSVNMFKKYPHFLWGLSNYHKRHKFKELKPKVLDYILENIPNHNILDFMISAAASIELLRKYPNIKWDWLSVLQSYHITMQDITDNMDLPWCWPDIIFNPNLNIEFLEKHLNDIYKDGFYISSLSSRKCITMDYIKKNPNKPWDDKHILRNSNLTMNMLKKFIHKYDPNRIDFGKLARPERFIIDIKIYSRNKIYYCWKKRNIRYKIEHRKRMKHLIIELKSTPPFAAFKGGIDYIAAMNHFNELK